MGTTTTNYTLYKPAVGERNWGEEVNGNFDTIDTTLKNLRDDVDADTGGGHIIIFEGVELPQRAKLRFGAGFYVYDDAVNDTTVIEFVGLDVPADAIYLGGEPLYLMGEPLVVGGA